MKKFAIIFLFIGINLQLFAQTNLGTIKGKVIGENGWPVSFATVVCSNISDSSQLNHTLTNDNGEFVFEKINDGKYLIHVIHISYENYISDTISITLKNRNYNIASLTLNEKKYNIQEVEVIAEKNLYKNDIRKKSFEVTPSILKQVSTTSELLNQIPGVNVDALGNVEVQGKSNILFLVNGIKYEGGNPLQILSPKQIKRIDIITNIPSRYISEGYTSIIEIKLKNSDKGLDGFVSLAAPTKPLFTNTLSLNYNISKTRIFSNYDFTHKNYSYDLTDNYFKNDTPYYTQKTNGSVVKTNAHKFSLGSDIFFNEKNYLTITSRLKYSDYNDLGAKSIMVPIDNNMNKREIDENLSHSIDNNLSLFYKHLFTTDSNKIETELIYYTLSGNDLYNYYDSIKSESNFIRKENLKYSDNSIKTNINYSYASDNDQFNIGYNLYSDVMSNNFDNSIITDNYIYNNLRNNIYSDFSFSISDISLMAGLGVENNNRKIGIITKKFYHFYPTGDISWNINSYSSLDGSYQKVIKRPNYWQLEPNSYYADSFTVEKGNPYLEDYFSNRYELKYTYIKSNNYFSFSCYIEKTPNIIVPFDYIENNIRISTFENTNSETLTGCNLLYSSRIFSWWKIMINTDFFNQNLQTESSGNNLLCFNISHYSYFYLPKGLSLSYQLKYKSKSLIPDGYEIKAPFMAFYLSKKLFKGAASFNFVAIQPFIKYKNNTIIAEINTRIESYQNINYRGFMMSFMYNFHFGKSVSRQNRNNSDWIENSKEKSAQ